MKTLRELAALLALLTGSSQMQAAESVSKAEVLAAIQASEASRGRAFPKGNCSSALQIGATAVSHASAGFVVAEIKFDPGLGQARFLLRSRGDRKAPPFYAWCGFQADDARELSMQSSPSGFSFGAEEKALGPVLVDVHRTARLYLHSQNGAAVLTVKPLQSGHQDERVRVRLPLHGKMIEARVIGPDALEAAF